MHLRELYFNTQSSLQVAFAHLIWNCYHFYIILRSKCFKCGFVGGNEITDSTYDLAVVDSNSMEFVFKHAPEVAEKLHAGPSFSLGNAEVSPQEAWLVR